MNTNFFKQIAQMNVTGDLHLIISKGADNTFIVSTLLKNELCGDEAKNSIVPLNLKGTAEELDAGYFDNITAPIERTSGLMDNMETFMKQLEEAKKQSAMEKEKKEKQQKEKDAKDKKYKDAMAKADELGKEGKYKDAWSKVPSPSDYPEKADEIRKRRDDFARHFAPDLFSEEENQAHDLMTNS